MKRFLKKRWLGLPVGIITVVLLVCLLAGSALAINGYIFFRGSVDAEVREAIAVGAYSTWDNLHPYGSDETTWYDCEGDQANPLNIDGDHDLAAGRGVLGDVFISIAPVGEEYVLTIETLGSGDTVGTGFVAGEWIVIPINLRNGSSVELDLGAYAEAVGLNLDYCWEENDGSVTSTESGQDMCREFVASGEWAPLDTFYAQIDGYGGKSGSAVVGAQVLFVKITVPQAAAPDTFTVTFSLARGVVVP